jgi:tRNA-dihydrouridine synthase B
MNLLLLELEKNPFLLAPMAGITDSAYRSFMKEMGAGILTTELVSAKGLKYNSEKTIKLASFEKSQSPVGIQLFGESPEDIAEAALWAQDQGADFVDLNFGCPVPKVVKKMAGSAVLKDLGLLSKILAKVQSRINIPLTMKTRTGWDCGNRNVHEAAHIAYNEGLTWVAIHGRTRSEAYSGEADWDYITWVKSQAKLPIIGNGDLVTPELALSRLKSSKCDGAMIGRGALKNPWIFLQCLELLNNKEKTFKSLSLLDVMQVLEKHLSAFHTDRVTTLQMKKFASWFSAGYPESTKFRQKVFQLKDKDSVFGAIESYFLNIDVTQGLKTSNKPFLMGGHG